MGQDAKTTKFRKVSAARAATKTGKSVHLTPTLSPKRRGSEIGGEGLAPANERLLDANDVGRRLKLSPRTVADMANDGRLPAYRIGTFLRFKWADVEQFITAHCKVRAALATSATGKSS